MTTSQTDKNHISISEGKFSMERVFTIYNDRTGDKMEFGPDMDGLDLWELRQYANDGNSMKITDRIILTQEQVSLLALAFQEVAEKHPIIRSFDRE